MTIEREIHMLIITTKLVFRKKRKFHTKKVSKVRKLLRHKTIQEDLKSYDFRSFLVRVSRFELEAS